MKPPKAFSPPSAKRPTPQSVNRSASSSTSDPGSASTFSASSRNLSKTPFSEFNFPEPIVQALAQLNFETATEVQSETIPLVLAGRDVLATAQTGTGKTAAFILPLLTRLMRTKPNDAVPYRVLIVAPTRELAEQIGEVLRDLTAFAKKFRYAVIIGGTSYGKQLRHLSMEPVFIVGTPGRIIDLARSGSIRLSEFGTLVIDEADRLLDMGFEPQIEDIIESMPKKRQTLMFTATLPPEVRRLVTSYLTDPVRLKIGQDNIPVAMIHQDVIELPEDEKEEALVEEIDKIAGSIIVFVRTKLHVALVTHILKEAGHNADALHGDLNQRQRRKVTDEFRDEKIRILVATDIAARGLDIHHIRHVINYDLPLQPEDYVHRIGRTGRNGAEGHSIAFVTPRDKRIWFRILHLIGKGPKEEREPRRDRGPEKSFHSRASERPSMPKANPSQSASNKLAGFKPSAGSKSSSKKSRR